MNTFPLVTAATSPIPNRIIDAEPNDFCDSFNRSPFTFSHQLASLPLFELSSLSKIAEELLSSGHPEKFCCSHNSQVSASTKFEELKPKEQVAEAILKLRESNSWIKLSALNEIIPEFDYLARQIILELEELTGKALRKEITWCGATIFLGSPNTVVPYHFDHEANFLFQIYGTKEVNLFDQENRLVLTEQEIESSCFGARALNYKQEYQEKASVYHLTPGTGVHHPIMAPHWVKNGDDISIMLSLGFRMCSFDTRLRVYKTNHYLRKLGLKPTPPGKSRWKDSLKTLVMIDTVSPSIKQFGAFVKYIFRSFRYRKNN